MVPFFLRRLNVHLFLRPLFRVHPVLSAPATLSPTLCVFNHESQIILTIRTENTVATPNSVSRNVCETLRNVLRWDRDGRLHPIEDFIIQYGDSKSSPPLQWINADENLRTDISDGKDYNIFFFCGRIGTYGGSLVNPQSATAMARCPLRSTTC